MFEKYRQSPVGAWHSAKRFSDLPKNTRPNATPLPLVSYRQLPKHPLGGCLKSSKSRDFYARSPQPPLRKGASELKVPLKKGGLRGISRIEVLDQTFQTSSKSSEKSNPQVDPLWDIRKLEIILESRRCQFRLPVPPAEIPTVSWQ